MILKLGPLKKEEINRYVAVTEKNKSFACVQGRVLFIINPFFGQHNVDGYFDIRPRLRKGWLNITNCLPNFSTQSIYISEDEAVEDYKQIGKVINSAISENKLFIDSKLPLVKYSYNEKK